MKFKREVLILAILLATIGFAKAETPTSINPQTVSALPLAEEEEPTGVLTSVVDKNELQDSERINNDLNLYDSGNLNLSFKFKLAPDTINFSGVHFYLKHILPIVKKMDSENIKMIEIL